MACSHKLVEWVNLVLEFNGFSGVGKWKELDGSGVPAKIRGLEDFENANFYVWGNFIFPSRTASWTSPGRRLNFNRLPVLPGILRVVSGCFLGTIYMFRVSP